MRAAQNLDRSIRIMGGLILCFLALSGSGTVHDYVRVLLCCIGLYGLITGITNFCPLYTFIMKEKQGRRRKSSAGKSLAPVDVRDLPFFEGFADSEIRSILELCILREYDSGCPVMEEGVHRRMLCIVFSGQLKIVKRIELNESKVIDTITDGDSFGEVSFFSKHPPSVSVICMDTCKILELDDVAFLELLERENALSFRLMSRLIGITSTRIRNLHEQIASLGHWVVQARQHHA